MPLGLALGLLFPLVTMVSQHAAPAAQIGIATATPIMARSLGGAVGVAALGSLLSLGIAERLSATPFKADPHVAMATAFAHSLQPVFWCTAVLCALAALATRLLPVRAGVRAGAALECVGSLPGETYRPHTV